jgi:biotin carboxyl carrier protein
MEFQDLRSKGSINKKINNNAINILTEMKQFKYTINGNIYNVTVNKVEDTTAEVEVNGTPYKVLMDKPTKKEVLTVKRPVQALTGAGGTPVVSRPANAASGGAVKSPLPGVILSIDCKTGDTVKKGQKLLVLEAMKMENTIPSDRDGVVAEIKVNKGDSVLEGAELVIIK